MPSHLCESLFLSPKLDGERASQFLILLAEFGLLGFKRDIFRAKQFDVDFGVAVKDLITRFGQLRAQRMREIELRELELARFELRLNFFDKMKVSLLSLRIVGVASHGDVPAGRLFIQSGAQFTGIPQPLLELSRHRALGGKLLEAVKKRGDLGQIGRASCRGKG